MSNGASICTKVFLCVARSYGPYSWPPMIPDLPRDEILATILRASSLLGHELIRGTDERASREWVSGVLEPVLVAALMIVSPADADSPNTEQSIALGNQAQQPKTTAPNVKVDMDRSPAGRCTRVTLPNPPSLKLETTSGQSY